MTERCAQRQRRNWREQRGWRPAGECLAVACFAGAALRLALRYRALPARIPSPFNGGGDAHGTGARDQLWLLVMLGGWIYLLMSIVSVLPSEAVNLQISEQARPVAMDRLRVWMCWAKAAAMAGLLVWMIKLTR